jgi:hypothetical protein
MNLFQLFRFIPPWCEPREGSRPVADVQEVLWQFVRGSLTTLEFEAWCYQSCELERCLGKDLHLDVIATYFDEPGKVKALREVLHDWLSRKGYPTCDCLLWGSLKKLTLGCEWSPERVDERFELVRRRTNWLELRNCRRCGEAWYVACDTVDDDWYFRRMAEEDVARVLRSDEWPLEFDGPSRYGLHS